MKRLLILCGLMSGLTKLRRDTEGNKFAPEKISGPMGTRTVYPPEIKSYTSWLRGFKVSKQYSRFAKVEHVDISLS